MAKYINVDRLRVEIIRLRKDKPFHNDASFLAYLHGLSRIEDFIDSLQPEPEADLEKEIVRFLSNSTKMNKGEWRGKYAISDIGFRAVAHHFYELGLTARK